MMKRYLLLFTSFMLFMVTKSQVNYSLTTASGTYTALGAGATSPTLITPYALYAESDEGYANAVPIGFNFLFNGTSYTTININANGYLTLGSPFIVDANETYYYDSLAGGPVSLPSGRPVIAPFWADMDLQVVTNLSYAVSGSAPNRVLTVQWSNLLWDYSSTTASISVQAKLFETTNVIQFVYNQESGTPSGASAEIGLAASGTGPGNFLSLSDATAAPVASSTVETKLFTRPATGQIYIFTPLSCVPPTNLQFTNVTATTATISWSAAAGASGYEYSVGTSPTPPSGSGTATTATTANLTGLVAGVNYVFVRTNCGGGTYSFWTLKAIVPCTTNIAPVNGAINISIPPNISWNAVPNATGYTIMFSIDGINYLNLGSLPASFTSIDIPGTSGGTKYWFYVRAEGGSDTASEACATNATSFTTIAPPANDSICNAIVLTLNGASDCKSTAPAGIESIEPTTYSCFTPNNTVWYKYTPTSSGRVNIIMKLPVGGAADSLNAWVSLWTVTGTCPSLTLTELSANCQNANLITSDSVNIISDSLTAGVTYYIMIDGVSGDVGNFCINLIAPPATPPCALLLSPANNATNVAVPIAPITWSTVIGATTYIVSLGTANPPPALGSIADTTVNITNLAYNTTYYWTITPTNGVPATGCSVYSFTTAAPPPPPANDECTGAIALAPSTPIPGTTLGGTQSLPANICNGFTGNANDDVWYKITVLSAGNATVILTPNGAFDAVLEAFTGNCSGTLTTLACADDSVSAQGEVLTLTGLTPGQVVYIRLFGYGASGTEGNYTIEARGSALLPVKLISFKGEKTGALNMLTWSTATEQNNRGFELQRSADGENFSPLIFVPSRAVNGNSVNALSYRHNDEKPFNGNSYYRLKQTDYDGKTSWSDVVSIKGIRSTSLVISAVYPNPVKENLKVILSAPAADNMKLMVTDMAGKVILQQTATVFAGDNQVVVNVKQLPSGSYLVKAVCTNGCETALSKFVKQ